MRAHRRIRLLLVLVAIGLVGAGAALAFEIRRLRNELELARRDVARHAFEPARRRLESLAATRPGWGGGEVDYLFGLCDWASGRRGPALEAFARVPDGSEWGWRVRFFQAEDALARGRWGAAEAVLAPLAGGDGPGAGEARRWLERVYRMEARFDDVRRLLRAELDHTRDPVGLLRALWVLDQGTVPLENIRRAQDVAAGLAPDEDRVWLGRARVALEAGRPEEAAPWLRRALAARADEPTLRAWLDWARAADRPDEALKALRSLGSARLTPAERHAWRAWLLRRRGDTSGERRAMEDWLRLAPEDTEALEQLAARLAADGDSAQAVALRARKRAVDEALDSYQQRMRADRKPAVDEYAFLGRLAEAAGRRPEARAWFALALGAKPGDPEAFAALERLAPPRVREPDRADPWAGLDSVAGLAAADSAASRGRVEFIDDAHRAGLAFLFDSGRSPERQMPEALAGGVGVLDYDGDGWLDVYCLQGGPFPPPGGRASGDRLFRNRGDGTFEDATERAGLAAAVGGYGHGVAVGDVDGDGRPDLFLTRFGAYALLRNRGDGTFEDATERAGLGGPRGWPTSAAFADLDGDGDLDLYVCHYLKWDTQHPTLCREGGTGQTIHCSPRDFPAEPDHLFRNEGGRFVDATEKADIVDPDGRGLGVVAADLDGDGRVDLFVANDQSANYAFRNLGGFRFEEVGHLAGLASTADGGYKAGMGVACGDLDGDGRPDLAVTNFYGESTTLYHNLGGGLFADQSAAAGLAAASRHLLGFGAAFLDADNDGHLDLMTANGHLDPLKDAPWRMPAALYLGRGRGDLKDVTPTSGPALQVQHLGRALASGDIDNDGRVDALLVSLDEPLVYFHNRTVESGHFVCFILEGVTSNRGGVGAVVTLDAGGRRQVAQRLGGGSYQSASDGRLHFGLGSATMVDHVEVRWPSGRIDRHDHLKADHFYRLLEGAPATPSPPHGLAYAAAQKK